MTSITSIDPVPDDAVKPRYVVTFAPAEDKGPESTVRVIYEGDDEDTMYSHVSAVEYVLMSTYESGEILIEENGEGRSIEYRDGARCDL